MICHFCKYEHDNDGDQYGCPNCHGEGLTMDADMYKENCINVEYTIIGDQDFTPTGLGRDVYEIEIDRVSAYDEDLKQWVDVPRSMWGIFGTDWMTRQIEERGE